MPTIRIPAGVFRAETRNMIPGRWHEANLIRWKTGTMSPIGGYSRITLDPLGDIPRNIYPWLDVNSDKHLAVLCDSKLFVQIDDAFVDRTPVGFADANTSSAQGYGSGDYGVADYGMDDEPRGFGGGMFAVNNPVRFSMDNWNSELLFMSSADGRVFVYDPITDAAPAVGANIPIFVRDMLVTAERHVMVFGSQGFPNRVAWSDKENRTGWNFANVTGQAGFYDLTGAGMILSAHKIPGGILIFTTTGVWLGTYIGAPYYYGFRQIAEGCAPISAHAVAVAGGRAFWMGKKNFWKYEGGIVTALPHTLGTDLFDNMDPVATRRVCAGYNGVYPEIWFFFPTDRKGELSPTLIENDKYVVYGFEPGAEWWADGWLSRSCFTSSPVMDLPLAGSDQSMLYQHEDGWQGDGETRAGLVYAEIGALQFDDGENNWQVHQCMVDNATGIDSVEFDFKGHYVRGGPEYIFHEGLRGRPDGYLDTHFTARDFSMRITGIDDVGWGMGAFVFNKVNKRGGR